MDQHGLPTPLRIMSQEEKKYVIIDAADVAGINFDDVMETSADTLRWNNDNTKTFVKYRGNKPYCLYGKDTYSESEIKAILNDPNGEWYSDHEV